MSELQRIVVIVPEGMIAAANEWERCVAVSEASGPPFVARWQRGGEVYAALAPWVGPEWLEAAQGAPVVPPWGADMEAAARARAALVYPATDAAPDRIAVIPAGDAAPLAVLSGLGLERIDPAEVIAPPDDEGE